MKHVTESSYQALLPMHRGTRPLTQEQIRKHNSKPMIVRRRKAKVGK